MIHLIGGKGGKSENPTRSDKTFMLEVYEQFYRLIFSTARKYCMDADDCEDVVQESLVKLIKKVSLLKEMPESVLASYIVSTTRNTAINSIKSRNRQALRSSSWEEDSISELESPELPLDERLYRLERSARLNAVLEQLSAEDRFLLEGKYILDYSDPALAECLGCKASSIRMKLTRVRRRVLKLMEKEGLRDHETV